ncbi:MAG: energy transducer TonB [Bacteroidales bacterium]|nr:energy transducer TonB [Bacteroidales bacterium]
MKTKILIGFFIIIGLTIKSQDSLKVIEDSIKFDLKASFKEGNLESYLLRDIRYPINAINNQIQGYVIISFTITKDGKISEMDPIKYPNKELALTSMLSLKSTDGLWNPTIYKNNPIDYEYLISYKYSMYHDNLPPEYLKKANKYYKKKDFKKSLKFYNKEIEENEYCAEPYLKRSVTKKELGDLNGSYEDKLQFQKLYNQFVGNIEIKLIGITREKKMVY